MAATERRLSSPMTIYYKLLFPTVWLMLGGAAMLRTWGFTPPNPGSSEIPVAVQMIVSVMWLAGVAFLLWFCPGLKKVRTDSEFLCVSNYLHTIRVPIGSVAEIAEHKWMNPIRISINFRTPTRFGQTITFIPKSVVSGTPHPITQELQHAAGLPVTPAT